jgi:hypothetical protein
VFLHDDANVIWRLKGPKGLHLFVLITFFHQKISITLQRMQTSSILSWVIVISLAIFWVSPFQDTPPITMANLLQAIDFWHGEIRPTYFKQSIFAMEIFWHLVLANLTSYKFSFFLFLIPLYIFQIYSVFINKILWCCIVNEPNLAKGHNLDNKITF